MKAHQDGGKNIKFKNFIKSERINYGGTITYFEEKEIDRISEAKIHKKNLVNSRFDEKEEKASRLEGKRK